MKEFGKIHKCQLENKNFMNAFLIDPCCIPFFIPAKILFHPLHKHTPTPAPIPTASPTHSHRCMWSRRQRTLPWLVQAEEPRLGDAAVKTRYILLPSPLLLPCDIWKDKRGKLEWALFPADEDIHCWAKSNFSVKISLSEVLKALRTLSTSGGNEKGQVTVKCRKGCQNRQLEESWGLCHQGWCRHLLYELGVKESGAFSHHTRPASPGSILGTISPTHTWVNKLLGGPWVWESFRIKNVRFLQWVGSPLKWTYITHSVTYF